MTGREALIKLESGYTLRREAWDPDKKCKAYFTDNNKTTPEYVPYEPKFVNYITDRFLARCVTILKTTYSAQLIFIFNQLKTFP